MNVAHLSAGPVEALVEFLRFSGQNPLSIDDESVITERSFGRMLVEEFGVEQTKILLKNPTLHSNGQSISTFDLTEEIDSSDAIKVLGAALNE